MKRILFLALIMLLLMFVTGCINMGGPSNTGGSNTGSGNGIIQFSFNWSKLDSGVSTQVFTPQNTVEPTHVGARVIYPDDNAIFVQSKTRELAVDEGVISMQVPASNNAHLYVAAIHHNSSGWQHQEVISFGVIKNLAIQDGAVLIITMDDVQWSQPTWVAENSADYSAILNGTIKATSDRIRPINAGPNAGTVYFEIPIFVNHPFELKNEVIGINGSSGTRQRIDAETFRIHVACIRPADNPLTSPCHFYPYLNRGDFNFPDGPRLPILPKIDTFTVEWE